MTAPEPTPTAEHTDAVARSITVTSRDGNGRRVVSKDASLSVARLQARTLLASTDAAVHAAMLDALVRAGVLTEEWALRYEHDTDPTMDDPGGVRTQTSRVASRAIAEQAVATRVPGGTIRNRRAERQYVTRWEVAP